MSSFIYEEVRKKMKKPAELHCVCQQPNNGKYEKCATYAYFINFIITVTNYYMHFLQQNVFV